MCALHMHIERTEIQTSQIISLAPPVASLLQCCAESAQTLLQTLRTLADDDLMGMLHPVHYPKESFANGRRCILTIPN
jgi:hypothetical protein